MNETINVLLNRSSVRSYLDKPIEKEVVESILETGLKAASAGNLQPLSIIKIEDKDNAKWFVDQKMQKFIQDAPLNLLFCLDFNRLKRWAKLNKAPFVMDKSILHFWVGFQDVIIAAQSIETAANAYGVGSVYIGTTIDVIPEIQEKFKLPKGVIPVVLLTMGYPKNDRVIANKLSQDIVVHNEEYQNHTDEFIQQEYYRKYGDPKLTINEERLEQILQVVKEVDGDEAVNEVRKHFENETKVNPAMRYFGLHYVANQMARYNKEVLDILAKNGLLWAEGKNYPDN